MCSFWNYYRGQSARLLSLSQEVRAPPFPKGSKEATHGIYKTLAFKTWNKQATEETGLYYSHYQGDH